MKKQTEQKLPDGVLLRCRDLSLAWEGRVVASGVNLDICDGDYLCIVGENGSGKSTLMKAMLGLHPIASGILNISPVACRAGFGYLPQQTPAQRDFPATVWEVVLSGCMGGKWKPFFSRADRARAEHAMGQLGITDLARRCYRDLSGGQQQRTLLARALCATGKLIFLDEPIAGLDPIAMQDMYNIIADMNRPISDCPVCAHTHKVVTVVMVSHDVQAAVKYATHILHMGKKIAFFGTTADYLKTDLGRRFAGEEGRA